jgi:adenylate cyclase
VEELLPTVVEPSGRIARVSRPLVAWLLDRHLERAIDALNVDALEAVAAQLGLLPAPTAHPPAILFVDLTGYTRLTEATGDELAARLATRLATVAGDVARERGGEVVKLLGDGAMLCFDAAGPAVAAGISLIRVVPAAGLPEAHVGISAGRVISRDGDYFGHTVNVAARVAGHAGPGEVLVTGEVVTSAGVDATSGAVTFQPIGPVPLRNITEPVPLFRAFAAPTEPAAG